ncbi:hypothetical protein PF005_g18663 [Phytophthora fragariae]|uniref:Uncharacterized protein n=1 Tax=Phytophthora fragariae TaxID=53985 RepID=A0A6A3WW98_9STRA|nr:hypothetical protein PF003_g30130 [Phytophthora fragariae]KAE8932974.1 hypothetical protein PF009_g17005 [Phytophthora fragariae]KAE8992811.1 hypothetical protein PF011_g17395 [Phytophthora fragariae]KAE9170682.1 hypothetical protein PF004_g27797 [Phytophthora fragariae]KAE9191897.1 hypothetical protein PF005_g18663 [Phytophthora fragariae]
MCDLPAKLRAPIVSQAAASHMIRDVRERNVNLVISEMTPLRNFSPSAWTSSTCHSVPRTRMVLPCPRTGSCPPWTS